MAITTALCNTAKQGFLSGAFGAGDTYKIALYTSAATLNSGTSAYSVTNEVTGTGYTAGGATLAGISYTTTAGTASIDWNDASWSASTITARGALIYKSDGGTNPAIATFDFGADIISTNGTFLVTIPASGTGVIRFA